MPETTQSDKINIIELLMGIKEDVSSIKTDMTNFKESQKVAQDTIMREIADVRSDYERDIDDLESRVMSRINGLQSVQATLVGDVDTVKSEVTDLKNADDHKDANKYRTILAFLGATIGGMALAKLPDFIAFIAKINVQVR